MKNQNTLQEMKNNRLTFWFDKKQVKLNSILFKWDTISLFKLTFFQHAINNSAENNSTKQFQSSFVLISSAVINITICIMLNYAFQLKIERNVQKQALKHMQLI